GKHGLCPPARSKALAAVVAAAALIGCSGVGTRPPATDTTVVEETIPAPSNTGSLELSRGGDYNVTAAWSFSRTCARGPQLRATATGSTADIVDLTGTSGSESLRHVHYRNVAATVELRCDGETLASETIAAPTGSLTLTRGSGDSLEVAWALNPSCSEGEIAAVPADGSVGDSHTISGTGSSVEFTDSKYKSQAADVTLDCNGARMVTETIAAPAITVRDPPPPPAITGTLKLSRGGDYNVTAAWSLSRTCGRNPRVRATASGSTAETFDLIGTGGSKSLSTAKYRNVAATVELRCAGVVLAKETIAAPTGILELTRGSANSVKVAWTLDPSCAAGTVTTSPAGETQTHDASISGTSGNVETTDSAYTTKGAGVTLKCNGAEIAAATIYAPITATLTVRRRPPTALDANVVIAHWTLSRVCNGTIAAVTADGLHTVSATLWGGDGGANYYAGGPFRSQAVTVTLTCEGKTLAEKTVAAP
ncbi:MAG: hypothetical protein OXP69_13320, partial [Spirochaetaceae bacterium]|nr:hypothetical protein [Spirochaetaceae bacterium]